MAPAFQLTAIASVDDLFGVQVNPNTSAAGMSWREAERRCVFALHEAEEHFGAPFE